MIQDDIDEIELAIKNGDNSILGEHQKVYYLEAIAKTQLLILQSLL